MTQVATAPEAEQAVLGSVLLDNEAYHAIAGTIQPEMFEAERHRTIWRTIEALLGKGAPADLVTIVEALRAQGCLDAVGGIAYLAGLAETVPVSLDAPHYVRIVADAWTRRQLHQAGQRLQSMAQGSRDLAEVLPEAKALVSSLMPPGRAHTLPTLNARDLMAATYPAPKYAVPGLIAEGLNLLVGAPKLGKSWLVLGVSVAVASGGHVLGKIKVNQGRVLYFALEDNPRRLQSRLETVLKDAPAPDLLEIGTTLPTLDKGGVDVIRAWLEAHQDARLVIVDTLARVKPAASKAGNAYDSDSAALGPLQSLALEHGVAIILVHHTRKSDAVDVFDTVSGSTGLTGIADATLILRRARAETGATLHVTGRDIEEQAHALTFDAGLGAWTIAGDASTFAAINPQRRQILEAMAIDPGRSWQPREVAIVLGESGTDRVRKLVQGLREVGLVVRQADGGYCLTPDALQAVTGGTGGTDGV